MIPCTVENHHSALLVTFEDGSDMVLQSDYDQVAFCVDCGLIKAPSDWDGRPSTVPEWVDCDPTDITECPDHYKEQADADPM